MVSALELEKYLDLAVKPDILIALQVSSEVQYSRLALREKNLEKLQSLSANYLASVSALNSCIDKYQAAGVEVIVVDANKDLSNILAAICAGISTAGRKF